MKKLGLEKNVKFTGLVTEDEKLQLLESATLFVLTSHSDVHPIAVQDALTMSLPVIITEACDYPEVKEYDAGLIVDEDSNQITKSILSIIDDKKRLEKMSKNARKLVLEKFELNVQIKKYEAMYKDVIKKFNGK